MFSISPGLDVLSSLQITPLLALGWLNILWGFLAVLLVILCIGLIMIILIQDPKGGGLAAAFGAGPSGESLLGAQAQQDITRITGWMTGILMAVVLAMVLIDNHSLIKQSAGTPQNQAESTQGAEPPKDASGALPPAGGAQPPAPGADGSSPPTPPAGAAGDADADTGAGKTAPAPAKTESAAPAPPAPGPAETKEGEPESGSSGN